MTRVHLLKDLTWKECRWGNRCDLPHHLPDVTVAEAKLLTRELITSMFALDSEPPHKARLGGILTWRDTHGEVHRDYDLPALIIPNSQHQWFQHGKLHRTAGPAVIDSDGSVYWYLNGLLLTPEEFNYRTKRKR